MEALVPVAPALFLAPITLLAARVRHPWSSWPSSSSEGISGSEPDSGDDYRCPDWMDLRVSRPGSWRNRCSTSTEPRQCSRKEFQSYCLKWKPTSYCCCHPNKVTVQRSLLGLRKHYVSTTDCTADFCPFSWKAVFDRSPHLCSPPLVGPQVIELGRGSNGRVLVGKRVIHDDLSRNTSRFLMQDIAVKRVQCAREDEHGTPEADALRECDINKRLSLTKHSSILHTWDCGAVRTQSGQVYVITYMDMARGGSLYKKVLHTGKFIPTEIRREYMKQMAQALIFLHTQMKLVHQDVKPGNFMLDGKIVKMIDFGFAKHLYTKGNCIGTISYMAPEIYYGYLQKLKCYADPKSDVWSLGISFYMIRVGKSACRRDRTLGIDDCFNQGSDVAGKLRRVIREQDLDHELVDLLLGMLQSDPNRRLTMGEVLNHTYFKT
eukprot:TRINITY_DN3761_c0_g2_i1.p1 TRINITY_DN3761_c0_g2~~TRINITY_DN3761_c0_g2_i1.p1  ORF type:complete len:443 (+),score=38.90 TRINITY_DN3761_c0_g2_i1:29-1330(+)